MFKNSFFYKYLSPQAGTFLMYVFMRILSALLMVATLVLVAPMFSLLFGTIAGMSAGADTVTSSTATDTLANTAVMQKLMSFLGELLALATEHWGTVKTLFAAAGVFAIMFLLKDVLDYLGLRVYTPVRTSAIEKIRNNLYKRILILPLSFFSKNKRGDLLSRMGNDVQDIDEAILKQVGTAVADIIMFILLVTALFLTSFPLACAMLVILPLAAWIIGLASRSLKRKSPLQQAALGDLTAHIEESMRGVKTILSYNSVPHSIKRFDGKNIYFTRLKTSVYRRTDLGSPVSEIVGTFFIVLLLIAGGWLIFNGADAGGKIFALSPEAFIVFLVVLIQLIVPAKNLSNAWFHIKRGRASVARIKDVLKAEELITQKENAVALGEFRDSIEFRNVFFSYGDIGKQALSGQALSEQALKGISLTIKKGQHIAFAGLSGSGKSTLINLIPRFYDPSQGTVLIDGKDIRDCKIDDIRALSSLISQDTILFNDTFLNNIRFGRTNASFDEVVEAAKKAYAHDFIMATEKGYNTIVGNSGVKISGGERQRISIARAILKDAPILILDEASASLDTQSELRIQRAIVEGNTGDVEPNLELGSTTNGNSRSKSDKTIITVAHRLSTIENADCIYVMENGLIAEYGTHSQLLATNGVYKKLHDRNSG